MCPLEMKKAWLVAYCVEGVHLTLWDSGRWENIGGGARRGTGLALSHFAVGSSGWLCGWLDQVTLTRKPSLLSVEDKLAGFLWFVRGRATTSEAGSKVG